ncbi:MAG TPA: hypothetical protein VFZ68_01115 [Acidimicrobiales bacterium]
MRPTHGPDPDPRDHARNDPRSHPPGRDAAHASPSEPAGHGTAHASWSDPPGPDQPDPPAPGRQARPGGAGDGPLWTLARAVDATAADASPDDGALVRVVSQPGAPTGQLAWLPLAGRHPLDLLLGFVAPVDWTAVGVCCSGRAYGLDVPGSGTAGGAGRGHEPTAGSRVQAAPGTARSPASSVRITMLLDRDGASAGLLRRGEEVIALPGSPEGTVADACRRALGLPTAPPPDSTAGLWTVVWLDRLVELASARTLSRGPDAAWEQVVSLHPAVGPAATALPRTSAGVAEIAARTRLLAAAWPWRRLREDPSALDAPGMEMPVRLAGWMDDGMWARAVLGALPHPDDLLDAVRALLPPALAEHVAAGVERSVGGDG